MRREARRRDVDDSDDGVCGVERTEGQDSEEQGAIHGGRRDRRSRRVPEPLPATADCYTVTA
jgi:hypothetical protein